MSASFRLFHRLIMRPLAADPLRTVLTLLAVALGVAIVVAMELSGTAAAGSFRSSLETLTGDAGIEVSSIGGVDERLLGTIATLPFPITATPRVEGFGVDERSGNSITLIGLDLLHQKFDGKPTPGERPEDAIRADNSIWVADGMGYQAGDRVRMTINARSREYVVKGGLPRGSAPGQQLIVMDIGAAQRALDKIGRLDRIEITLPAGSSTTAWLERLRTELPAGVEVRPLGARTEENRKMLDAFRWNLRVLSYIALIVGAFLIYNTIAVSVVRRRAEIGILRAMGATRRQVVAAFLAEAGFFGLAGATAGVALGRVMAEGTVGMLAGTVQALYVSSAPAPIELSGTVIAIAFIAGISVSLASALAPALEASRVAPVDAVARGRHDYMKRVGVRRDLLIAWVVAAITVAATQAPPVMGKPMFGYIAALLLILSGAYAIPAVVVGLNFLWKNLIGRLLGVEAMLASRSLAASLARTSVLVGALATAVAMMVSVGIMVGSFRQTVSLWLVHQLRADLFLRPVGASGANRYALIPSGLAEAIETVPGVAAVDRFRLYDISYQGLPALLGAGQTEWTLAYNRTSFLPGHNREAILRILPRGEHVIISEPFANKHGTAVGDEIELALGGVNRRFEVLGIYRDFSNERGYIMMDREVLRRYLPDAAASSLAVFLDPGADLAQTRRRVEAACAGSEVLLSTNRDLRERAMRIFDRTFAITYALEAVAAIVAVMGIAGALLALVIDRRREMAVLRFLGASAGQIRALVLFEAGLLGLLSNLVGLALGFTLSLILIFVINKQSFGWTIEFHLPMGLLLAGMTLVYAATVLAGLYPARMAARMNPIEVVHED